MSSSHDCCCSAVDQSFDASSHPEYSSVDLLMRATFTQDSVWDDLGVTQQAFRQAVSSILGNAGWNMVRRVMACSNSRRRTNVWAQCACYMQTAVVPMVLEIATEAAEVLKNMPLPSYSSYQLVLQVSYNRCISLVLLFEVLC